jgi:hypothetical protein
MIVSIHKQQGTKRACVSRAGQRLASFGYASSHLNLFELITAARYACLKASAETDYRACDGG